jgi:PEP-CTERM motif
MRQFLQSVAVAAGLAAACGGAQADASVKVSFSGPGANGLTLDGSGTEFTFGIVPVTVRAGESADFFYDYTITLQDDGLAAARSWGFCVPLFVTNCGPAPTGHEQAYITLVAGFVDGRATNPFVSIRGDSITLSTDGGSFADGLTQSGRLQVHVEGPQSPFSNPVSAFSVYAFAAVDASPLSPVPEPATYALLLAGLGVLGLRAHRHRA